MTTTYTKDDFLAGKVSIRCYNEKQKKIVLKFCENNGIVWRNGKPISEDFPDEPVLTIGYFGDGRLTYGRGILPGLNIVDFSEIDFSHTSCYQIIIDSDGDTTTAKMVVNGKEIKTATAKRNPADKPNWHIGAQTAFDRLWEKKEKPEKPAEKDGFKVGDRVECVATRLPVCNNKRGRIVEIDYKSKFFPFAVKFDECISVNCGGVVKKGRKYWFDAEDLRHEQPAVQEVARYAKVGEWVKIVDAAGFGNEVYKNGYILRVEKAYSDGVVHLSCGGNYAYPSEYVVLEGYKP